MENTLFKSFDVNSFALNPEGLARITTIANFLQETAYAHAKHLKLGYHDLETKGTAWVLSRMQISMKRFPAWNESLKVETWPHGIDKLFALRDFRIRDENDHVIASAATCWLMVNMNNHRPVRLSDDFIPIELRHDKVYEQTPGKIDLPEGMVSKRIHEVRYSDLDVVGHVNNVKYIEWLIDLLVQEGNDELLIENLEINYIAEAGPGTSVELLFKEEEAACYVSGINTGSGKECFRARLSFSN